MEDQKSLNEESAKCLDTESGTRIADNIGTISVEAAVLGNKDAIATIAVKNLDVASKFYEGKLGLERVPAEEQVLSYKSGNSRVLVYESQFAGTSKATAATWVVGDEIERLVEALKTSGVTFEHYDFPGATLQGDIHLMGKTRAAWMTDPDGNILALVNG